MTSNLVSLSPLFPVFFITLVILIFIYFYRQKTIKHGETLIRNYRASVSIFGDLDFTFSGLNFRLARIGQQSFTTGMGGSYPQLSLQLKRPAQLVICNALAKNILYLGDFPPSHRKLTIEDQEIVLVSKSDSLLSKFENALRTDLDFQKKTLKALQREFAYLKCQNEIRLCKQKVFCKTPILKFTGLPDPEIYGSPEALQPYLDFITEVVSRLD